MKRAFLILLLAQLACSQSVVDVTEPPIIETINVAEPTPTKTNTPTATPVSGPFMFRAIVPNLLVRNCPDNATNFKEDCLIITVNGQPLYVPMSQDTKAYSIAQGVWFCLDEQCKRVTSACANERKYVIVTTQGYKSVSQICANEE